MYRNQILNTGTTAAVAADPSQPAAKLTPEVVVEQLRAIREQMPEITPITPKQRQALARRGPSS